jgi:succinate-semialdehyde dehydrogenase/glutarate-semialdehyde dehydrogenase
VDRSVHSPFIERFVAQTRKTQILGNPIDPRVSLGPVVSRKAAQSIRKQVTDAVSAGAKVNRAGFAGGSNS